MILMVYNKGVCKEFLLPNIHDADYTLVLHRNLYGFLQDIHLKLENSSLGWELVSDREYRIRLNHEDLDRCLLHHEDIVGVKTENGERLQIIVVDSPIIFRVMEKYDISMMKEVSIGKNSGNLVQYRFMELVSGFHANLIHHSDGWYLEDMSRNGVFCDDRRIQGRRKLNFGDHVDIFGLHLLFLGEMIVVGTHYGELNIKEDILRPVKMDRIQPKAEDRKKKKESLYFNRSPRNLATLYKEDVEIELPPNPKAVKQKPVFLTIGPAFTMAIPMMLGCGFAIFGSRLSGHTSGAFMYTGLVTAVTSAIIGVLWAFLNLNYSKKENIKEENERFNAYSNYLIRIAESLREKYRHNVAAMNQIYPSATQCLSYTQNSSELWNRNRNHADFLYQRLGLGNRPFQVSIQVPKEKFTLIDDSLLEKPKMIQEEFQTLHNVPVGISLMEKNLIGLVGGEGKRGAIELMHTLVAGITAAHCYTDVKLVFIYREQDQERQKDWECMRWFPHVWSEDKSTRYMAADGLETSDVFFELTNVLRTRAADHSFSAVKDKKIIAKPHYVIFISDPEILEGEILAKYIYEAKPEYGLTTFLMVERVEELPNVCEDVIENDQYFKGIYNLMDTDNGRTAFTLDKVDRNQLLVFGQTLANIRVNEIENNSEIPNSLDFFEMYGIHSLDELHVLERWRKNRNYNSMRVLIGKKAGNADCYLDIHEKFHGPHGLIAGTTGSGKSETLQTYILSLAINFSPEDVSFFIIDFKGGGMANLFSELPHLTGQISNLSGNQVRRAMISIKSENMRRQRLFSEYGVNNINLYTRLYKNHEAQVPIPHLFIIIDEFAELKREEPDFMRELISVAQVGRSLGVHLILATQKPSGTVDDNIWSNSKFRLCLRVQDRQDSNDMLHRPDAAFITQAGRCYLQVGNDEIFELFQSGYSGAIYKESAEQQSSSVTLLTRTGKVALVGGKRRKNHGDVSEAKKVKEKTQLEAVIEYLGEVAGKNHYNQCMQLWMPVLKTEIYLDELDGFSQAIYREHQWKPIAGKWNLEAVIGLLDDPEHQAQNPLTISFSENGHHAVCGAVVSGKSTFLQSMIYSFISKYSPDILQMYLIDYSSHMLAPFEKAPHVGGVVYDSQEEKLAKLMYMLTTLMDERKKMFQGGNYSQYVQAYGIKLPALFLVIDNFSAFREKTKNVYDGLILRIAREGVGYGIYLTISAAGFGISEIPSQIGDNIRTVISLEQADKFKYMEVMRMTHINILPETDVRGRGLALVNGRVLEFQTALSLPAADDFERGQKIEKYCMDMREHWDGVTAMPIPQIPEKPTLEILCRDERYQKACISKKWLPFGYCMEDASIYSVDLSQTYCYVISGRNRTGKTNVLKLVMHAAWKKQGQLCVIETNPVELKKISETYGADYVSDSRGLFKYFEKLMPEFIRRNKKKRELLENGLDEADIFEQMKEERPIFIFAADIGEFFKMVYKPEAGVGNMSGFLENILERGSLHHIYFMGCLKVEDESLLMSYKGYNLFVSYKKGIHLGGNLAGQKIFNFQNIAYAQQTKTMKKGMGYVPKDEEDSIGMEVVVPVAKKKV